jgi:16S rRNA processing protein RimM
VQSHTDPPQRLLDYREWVLRLGSGERITRRVAEGRAHAEGLVAHLEGVAGRDEAAALTGAVVEIDRASLPPPGERQYYRADLAGFRVRNQEGSDLGTVSHFVDAPAGAVMVSRTADGAEHWVLADPTHLRSVDLDGREIVVDWPAQAEEKAR